MHWPIQGQWWLGLAASPSPSPSPSPNPNLAHDTRLGFGFTLTLTLTLTLALALARTLTLGDTWPMIRDLATSAGVEQSEATKPEQMAEHLARGEG